MMFLCANLKSYPCKIFSLEMKNSIYAVLYRGIEILKPLILIPLLLNNYGEKGFGLYSMILIMVSLLFPFFDAGIGYSFQRFFYQTGDDKIEKNIIGFQWLGILFFSSLFLVLFNTGYIRELLFADYYSFELVLCVLIYVVLTSTAYTSIGILKARQQNKQLIFFKITFEIIEVAIVFLYCIFFVELDFLLFLFLSLSKLLQNILIFRKLNISPNFSVKFIRSEWPAFRKFFNYSLLIIPTAYLGFINSSSDSLLLSHYFSLNEVGEYNGVLKYLRYIGLVTFPITFNQLPVLAKMYDKGDLVGIKKRLLTFFIYTLVATILGMLVFYMCKDLIYFDFLKFENIENVEGYCFYLLPAMLLINMSALCVFTLNLLKLNKYVLWSVLLASILNVGLNLFFLKSEGPVYAAKSTLISECFLFSLYLIFLSRIYFKQDRRQK